MDGEQRLTTRINDEASAWTELNKCTQCVHKQININTHTDNESNRIEHAVQSASKQVAPQSSPLLISTGGRCPSLNDRRTMRLSETLGESGLIWAVVLRRFAAGAATSAAERFSAFFTVDAVDTPRPGSLFTTMGDGAFADEDAVDALRLDSLFTTTDDEAFEICRFPDSFGVSFFGATLRATFFSSARELTETFGRFEKESDDEDFLFVEALGSSDFAFFPGSAGEVASDAFSFFTTTVFLSSSFAVGAAAGNG